MKKIRLAVLPTGENFGPERVRGQLQATLDALNGIISQSNSGNPDSSQHLGLIPQRLPSLNYRASELADKGYAVTDIDALTGAQPLPLEGRGVFRTPSTQPFERLLHRQKPREK